MKYRVALTCVYFAFIAAAGAKTPGEVAVGDTLRNVQMRGLNGPSRNLQDLRGKPLLINVWASWCGPCKQEMGSLERLAWRNQGVPLRVIGISTDDSDIAAQNFLRRTNATVSHYIDAGLVLENMLGADRLPLTVLVDSNGKVLAKFTGAREWDQPESIRWIETKLRAPNK
jgi:thiol-disulfide isomerase/thioredoxin